MPLRDILTLSDRRCRGRTRAKRQVATAVLDHLS
jgi:hypothetical protein